MASKKSPKKSAKLPYVIIRTYSAGAHAGELVSRKGKKIAHLERGDAAGFAARAKEQR